VLFFASLLVLGQGIGGPGGATTALFFGVMLAVMYLIMIRPQQKQAAAHKAMVAALVKGDEVVTQGGMIGKINAVTERIVTLEIASGVKVRVLKTSIQGKYSPAAEAAAPAAKPDESKESKEEK
jgi:preprotein translocase subunit YajC